MRLKLRSHQSLLISLILIVSIFWTVNANCQDANNRNTYVEFSVRRGTSLESNYLFESSFKEIVSDTSIESDGISPESGGINYGIGIAIEKQFAKDVSGIANIKFHRRGEKAYCFCHVCDKPYLPFTITNVNSLALGLGIRVNFIEVNNIAFRIDALTNYGVSLGSDNLKYFGITLNPVLDIGLKNGNKFQMKLGLEKSFWEYRRLDIFFETGFSVKLKNNYVDGAKA